MNNLFAGSDADGGRAAAMYTIIQTVKFLHDFEIKAMQLCVDCARGAAGL